MRLFLLVRHGQSLFQRGRRRQRRPAARPRALGAGDRGGAAARRTDRGAGEVGLVLVSPFPRAVQTANIALAGRHPTHVLDDDLGDVRIGELEGRTLDDYRPPRRMRPGRPASPVARASTRRRSGTWPPSSGCSRATSSDARRLPRDPGALRGQRRRRRRRPRRPLHSVANATPYVFDAHSLARAVTRIHALAG